MKKAMLLTVSLLCACGLAGSFPALAEAAPEEGVKAAPEGMTQGELAQLLVQKLGLYRILPLNASDLECVEVLMRYGIYPSAALEGPDAGWDIEKEVTAIDFVRILVRALGLQGEVVDPNNEARWMEVLKSSGVSIETVVDGVEGMRPIYEMIMSFPSFSLTQDPLYKNPIAKSDVLDALDAINLPHVASIVITPPTPRPPRPPDPPRPDPVTPVWPSGNGNGGTPFPYRMGTPPLD